MGDVFYLGESSDSNKPRGDPRRRRYQHEQAEIYEILTWGRKPDPPLPPPAPLPHASSNSGRAMVNRWVTEKMDQFDHTSTVVVLSPSRKSRRHRSEATIDLEGLVGKEEAEKMLVTKAQKEEVAAGTQLAEEEQTGPIPSGAVAPGSPTHTEGTGMKTPASSPAKRLAAKTKKQKGTPTPIKRTAPLNKRGSKAAQPKFDLSKTDKGSSRDMSNTAFAKAFQRPIFGPYFGSANIQPLTGGVMYGNYLLSHNVGPEMGTNHPRTKQVFPGAELKALARSQPIKAVPFDPKLNERMPLQFLSTIEPKYAALSDFINKGKEQRLQKRAARGISSPTRHKDELLLHEEEEEYVLINMEDVPPASKLDNEGAGIKSSSEGGPAAGPSGAGDLVAVENLPPAPRKRGIKPPPPPPADMPALPLDLKNNPKVYKLLPSNWTSAIVPAGVTVKRGESVKDCLHLFE